MTCPRFRFSAVISVFILTSCLVISNDVLAAGFEVGEHTPQATARGGTGVVNTADPSAINFNPALLSHVQDTQIFLSANILAMDVEFQRNDLVLEPGGDPVQSFEPTTNQTGLFPIPFIAASFDIGPDDLTAAVGLFTPPAFGNPCYGTLEDGECQPVRDGAARGMVVETDMIVAYFGAGVGYGIDLGEDRQLDLGLTGGLAYQNSNFAVMVEADLQTTPPWQEDPDNEAFVRGSDLSGVAPLAILGIAYTEGPMRIGASYRPPIRWTVTGTADVEFSELLQSQEAQLSDNTIHLETWSAGSLRLGWGLQGGEHPANPDWPRWDFEINTVWENWSLVDNFRIELDGDIEARAFPPDEDGQYPSFSLHPIYQRKGYQDTLSLRSGFSFGVNSWLTAHSGGFLETAAQPKAYTSADFISWERYAASVGTSFHLPADLRFDLGYSFIHSPSRTVNRGEVYNPIPMSRCQGPDFDADQCETAGTPPGNPQNEGEWSAHFHILSAGISWVY